MDAYELHSGFLVEGSQGVFCVSSLRLLREASSGKSAHEIARSPDDLTELEHLHRYGVIRTGNGGSEKLITHEAGNEFSRLYENRNLTWFSYIPQKIEMDITTKCNLRCIHCSRKASPEARQGSMTLEDYIRIIEQAAEIGVPNLTVMGGEPTTHPEFIELALIARVAGVKSLSTSTNGWLVDAALAHKMARLFGSVQVSLHGAKSATHDAIVGRKGAFERAVRALSLLRDEGVASLNISFSVMRQNATEISAMVELAKELGITELRFLVLTPEGRALNLSTWGEDEKREIADQLGGLRVAFGNCVDISAGGFPPYDGISKTAAFYGCPAGRNLLYIDAQGRAKPCHCTGIDLGDVRESPLLDLWHSKPMQSLRSRLDCCEYSQVCAGGCLGNEEWLQKFFHHA